MYQNSRRLLSVVLCFLMLVTCMTSVTFAQTSGTQEYATKVLYALDQAELATVDMQYANDVIKASDDDYPNVEVLGVTNGIRAWKDVYYDGNDRHPTSTETFSHSRIEFLTAGAAGGVVDNEVKNITYKIISSNPNGFEELDISFIGRVEATIEGNTTVSPFLAVQGSDTAPAGEFGDDSYFDSFADLRRITESNPDDTLTSGHDNETPDYYNFGETITLTNEVKGKSEYYVNFSYVSEVYLSTVLTDISFAEKVPVEFSNTDKYEDYVIADADCSAQADGNRLWSSATQVQSIVRKIGFEEGSYEAGTIEYNGLPYFVYTNTTTSSTSRGYSFYVTRDWGFSSVTFKLKVPAGRKIEGLTIDYDGNLSITEAAGKRSATSIITYVGDSSSELGLAKRLTSYTDGEGNVAKNLGTDLDAFTVEGNGKDEIWVRLMIAGGTIEDATNVSGTKVRLDNYINKMKVTAHLKSNKVSQGTEITDENYAAKLLYALDMGKLSHSKTVLSTDMVDGILTSADDCSNVEILGATEGLLFNKLALGNISGYGDAEQVPVLTASAEGVKNITYKITSSNPDGFNELDISYLAGVNSTDGSSYVTVQGSDEAPLGTFGSDDYYNTFGDIRSIYDTTPGTTNIAPADSKDYHDYGETLILTDEVKGKKEYYVNFSINAEGANKAWLSDIAFIERIKTDFSDTERYTTMTLVNSDYTNRANNFGGGIGYNWQAGTVTNGSSQDYIQAIAAKTDNSEIVNAERWLMFRDGYLGVRDFGSNSANAGQWTCGSFVIKLTAPEGKIFKGLNVELKGKNTIDTCAGANKGASITASVSDEFAAYDAPSSGYKYKTGMGAVKRFYSYTDANAVAKSVGDLTPFKVIGNNKNVMYLKVAMGNGDITWNHLTGMKIDGIFADESVIDDVVFSGNGAFPTNGSLTAVYKVGAPKTGETMPAKFTLIVAAYQKAGDTNKLIGAKAETIVNPLENTDYTVILEGLPKDENNCFAKAFVWTDVSESLKPISNVYKLGAE